MENKLNPRKPTRQNRAKKTIELILEAATRLLQKEKIDSTSTNHIAKKAGISVGSLYQYFPNKESIFTKVARREAKKRRTKFNDQIVSLQGVEVEAACRILVAYITEAFFHKKEFNSFFVKNVYTPELIRLIEHHENELQRMVGEFLKSRLPNLDEKQISAKAFTLLHSSLGILRAATLFDSRNLQKDEIEEMLLKIALSILTK